jgi:WD40 repeat protein
MPEPGEPTVPVGDDQLEVPGTDMSTGLFDSASDRLPPPAPVAVPALKLVSLTTRLGHLAATEPVPPPELPDYQILGELGRGGMGIVYKARDLRLDRLVALKMILAQAGPEDLARFRREALAVAHLHHPSIIQIYEVGESQGRPYLALELAEGGSLAARLRGEPLPPIEAAQLLEVLARTLHAVHQQGVIHRDLKPANILLAADGTPRISDFGLAKQVNDQAVDATHSGAILGTPSYMAPEQARGEIHNIGPATDVYALGVLLYELLTGGPPFRADSVLETLQMVCHNEAVPPRALQPRCPRDLETICLRCLQKTPERRYGSALELADDLHRFLAGEPIRARPVGILEHVSKWAARSPALAALLTVSVLVTVLGFALVLWQWHRAEIAVTGLYQANLQEKTQRRRAEDALADARTQLYFNGIAQADREWRASNAGRADQVLDLCLPTDLRAWEWFYLKRLCHTERLTLTGHESPIRSVAFAPRTQQLASASSDGTIQVHDLVTGAVTLTFQAHNFFLEALAWSPDGQYLATGNGIPPNPIRPGELKLWNAGTGKEVRSLPGHTREVLSVAWSTDSRRLASGSADRTVKVWDITTGQELHSFDGHTDSVTRVAFSPDGQQVASASRDHTVRVWDLKKAHQTHCLRDHRDVLFGLAWSPDGKHLASCGTDQTARLWNLATGTALVLSGHSASVNDVAFSPDGKSLATVSHDRTLKIWDTATGLETLSLKGHATYLWSVAWSPDGKQVATGSGDQTVKLWDPTTYQGVRTLGRQDGAVTSVAVSPDGQRFASASSLGSDAQGKPLPGAVKVWDAATGKELVSCVGHMAEVSSVTFSPDGKRLASAGGGFFPQGGAVHLWSEVHVWEAGTGRLLFALQGHTDRATSVVFSPDGTRLATASWDGTVRLWNADTGKEERVLHGHTDTVWSVAFSPDGKLLASAARDRTVRLWDLTSAQEPTVLNGHTQGVQSVAFSSDGETLASGSFDRTVKLWNPRTGVEMTTLRGHTEGVFSVAFDRESRRLASAALDQTIKLWDRTTGQEVLSLESSSGQIVFSPDVALLVGAGRDGTIQMWDGRPRK